MKKLLLALALLAPISATAQTILPTGGGGSSTPCTTTALSLQYNSAGAFGCVSGWTTNGSTALTGGASTTIAIGGATIGTNALAVTGTTQLSDNLLLATGKVLSWNADTSLSRISAGVVGVGTGAAGSVAGTLQLVDVQASGKLRSIAASAGVQAISGGVEITDNSAAIGRIWNQGASIRGFSALAAGFFGFVPAADLTASVDTILSRAGAASLQHGAADAAVAVAQTIRVQSVVAGTADTAGANWTNKGSVSTGSAASGNWIVQVGGKGAASTSQNTLQDGLTVVGATTNNTNVGRPSVVVGNSALATTATDGFLYIPSGAGTPTATPTGFTGRVPLYYDTTNHQFWIFDGSWLQPKTPAGAATVTWQ